MEASSSRVIDFQIVEAMNLSKPDMLYKIFEEQKQTMQTGKLFDANSQNLAVVQFLLSRSANSYLNRLEKRGVSVESLIADTSSENSGQALSALYMLYNLVFFRKLSLKAGVFAEPTLAQLNLSLERFRRLPPFPFLKLFLSKLNFNFNIGALRDLEINTNEANKLADFAALANSERPDLPVENRLFVSCLFGGIFYHLAHVEQNNFCPNELKFVEDLVRGLKALTEKNGKDLSTSIEKLNATVAILKEQTTLPYKPLSLRLNEEILLIISQKSTHSFEERLLKKLISHATSSVAFLSAAGKLKVDRSLKLDFLSSCFFSKKGPLKEKYFLAVSNAAALMSTRNDAPATSRQVLKKILTKTRLGFSVNKNYNETKKVNEIGKFGNLMLIPAIQYNLALSFSSQGSLDQALTLMESISQIFQNKLGFWYRKGVNHFKAFIKELDVLARQNAQTFADALSTHSSSTEPKGRTLRALNCGNVFELYQEQNLKMNHENSGSAEEPQPLADTHFNQAICSFSQCLLICRQLKLRNDLQSQDYRSKGRKAVNDKAQGGLLPTEEAQLISSYEHLAFLHLVAHQPMQALRVVKAGLQAKKLTAAQKAKFRQYGAIALAKLLKFEAAKEEILQAEASVGSNSIEDHYYYPLSSGKGSFRLGMKKGIDFLRSSLQLLSGQGVDAGPTLYKLCQEMRVSDKTNINSDLETYFCHSLYFFFARVRYSGENMSHLLSQPIDFSKISFKV